VQPDRLGVREHARRHVRRAPVVGDGALGLAAPGVLLRQLRGHRVEVVGVQQLEALGDASVEQPAPRRAEPGVGGVAQQVVGEVVALPTVAVLAQYPAAPQLVDSRDDPVGVQVGGHREQVQRDVPADRRGDPGDLLRRRAGLVEPVAQHGGQIPGRERSPAHRAHRLQTCRGNPPVTAASSPRSESGSGPPRSASASRAVSFSSNGPSARSVSIPDARRWAIQSASAASSGPPSSRRVAASSTGACGSRPRQKVRKDKVSSSHHCTLSRTSSIGRPTPSSARATPS
jgi:hypothetical protein